MSAGKGGLGRGLGELFTRTDGISEANPQQASDKMPDGSYFKEIAVSKIHPNPAQPRQVFDEEDLEELAASVKEVGLLQPIVVREKGDGFELIMGERRWRAHKLAGLKAIPAIVRATDDQDLLRDALLENLHRVQLNPLEEAAAYQQLLNDFDCSQEELAARIKKSRPNISNTLRLLKLPASVQRRVAAEVLSAGHARALLALADPLAQEQLAQRIVAEGLSVRATEELVAMYKPGGEQKKPTPAKREVPPELASVADRLADLLDTRVKLTMGAKKGKVTIEFADEGDLKRILQILE